MATPKADFSARIKFVEGRASLQFEDYPEFLTSCDLGNEAVAATDAKRAVRILGQEYFAGRLVAGMKFRLLVGGASVARGELIEVLNPRLALTASTPAASINLNQYPADIQQQLKADFGDTAGVALRNLQELLAESSTCRSPRVIRALLFVAGGDRKKLADAIDLAEVDYRDLLMQAEYVTDSGGNARHMRDFRREGDPVW